MDVRRGWGVVPAAVIGLTMLPGSAAAPPPEGDVVRTDLAKGETGQPVSITTAPGERSTLLVQDLQMRPGSRAVAGTPTPARSTR